MGLPNLLTAFRILLIPLFIGLLIYQKYLTAAVIFCLAGVTDILDGQIARLTDSKTRLGAFLDPMADKLLAVSSFVALSLRGPIPVWFVVIVISRDVIISLGSLIIFLNEGKLEIAPSSLGKATTFCQFLTILLTIVTMITGHGLILWRALLPVTALLTILSGLQYLHRGLKIRS